MVYRFLPRYNPDVNDYWLCDHGRFLSESLNARDVYRATLRQGNSVQDIIVPAGIQRLASEIRTTVDGTGPAGLFFLGSAHLSNEENFLLRKLADHLACPNRDVERRQVPDPQDQAENGLGRGRRRGREFPGRPGHGPRAGQERLRARGRALRQGFPGGRRRRRRGLRRRRGRSGEGRGCSAARASSPSALAPRTRSTRAADVVLPACSLAEKEGTFTNVQGRVQRFERAFLPRPPVRATWELLLQLSTELGFGDRNWTPADLLAAIAKEIPAYAGIDPKDLEGGRLLKKGDFAWHGTL